MGLINVAGTSIHSSALSQGATNSGSIFISGTNSNISISNSSGQYLSWGGNTINYSINKSTYHVLGEDIKVEGYVDPNLAVAISTLNILGKPFYDELKKNDISFPTEIEDYLEVKFKIIERDRKINDLLK